MIDGEDGKIQYYFLLRKAKCPREEDDFRENFEMFHRVLPGQVRKQ